MTLLLLCGVCNAWGTSVTQTYTLSDNDNGNTVTKGDVSFAVSSGAITASGSNMKLTGTITVTLPNGAELSTVEITKSNNWGSGATVVFASQGSTLNTFTSSGTFNLSNNKTNLVYTFSKGGTASKNAWVKEIKVTYEIISSVADPKFSVTEGSYKNAQSVSISCDTENATIYYTTDGSTPTSSSNEYTEPILISKSTTLKAIAIKGTDKSNVTSAAYKITTYANLEDLIADGKPSTTATPVTVTLTDEVIQDFYIYNKNKSGIILKAGTQDIVIYCTNVPEDWIVSGKVSGTLSDCDWKLYSSIWELCPSDWSEINYTAPTMYAINIDNQFTNGTIEASATSSPAGVEVTLTVYPEDGYKLASLTVKDADDKDVTVTNNKFTMPASDVTISATFTEKAKHFVLYSSLGEEVGKGEEVYDGEFASLPTPENSLVGYTFAGWTANDEYAISSTAPVFFTETTPVNNDVILYAVFKKVIGEPSYQKVTADQQDWRGDYLIAFSNTIFMDGSLAGGDPGVGAAQTHVSPSSSLSGNTVSATWGDLHYVTIEAIDDANLNSGYVIKSHSDTKPYFYQSSNSNGISYTAVKTTAATYPITITFNSESDVAIALGGAAVGAVLHYNNTAGATGEMFRFYKNGGQQPIYLYKKTEGECIYTISDQYNVLITDAGWATACLPFNAKITSDNATAYYVTGTEGAALTKEEAEVIPAETGILLKSNDGGAATVTFTASAEEVDDASDNLMVGSLTDTEFKEPNTKYYILTLGNDNKVGFYWDWETNNSGASAKCPAGKAVLAVQSASAKTFFNLDDEATGINNVEMNKMNNGIRYNLNGQAVGNDFKGVVIVNGKKFVK